MRSLAPVQTETAPTPAIDDTAPSRRAEILGASEPETDETPRARGSRATALAIFASVVWLAAAAAAIYLLLRYQPAPDLTLTGLAGIAAGVTAPLTAIWLIALVVGRASADERRSMMARIEAAEARVGDVAVRTRRELAALDGVLQAVADRVEAIRGSIGGQSVQLMETAGRLEERTAIVASSLTRDREMVEVLLDRLAAGGAAAHAELAKIIEALPRAEAQANAIGAALATGAGDARRQIEQIDALAATGRTRSEEAQAAIEAAVARLTQTIGAIEAASGGAAERLNQRTVALKQGADTAIAQTAEALDTARRGIEAQVAAVRAGTEEARTVLESFSGEASQQVAERFAEAAAQAERLTREMQAQEARSRSLIEAVERSFGVLDAKLSNAAQTSGATLDRLNERLAAVREQMHELATPLGSSETAARGLETAVAALRTTAAEAVDTLSGTLPAQVGNTARAVEIIREEIATLATDLAALNASANEFNGPVEHSRSVIEAAVAALDAQRESLQATVAAIGAGLVEAKAMAAEVDDSAQTAALTATTRLVDAMSRVREIAAQAEGTMRTAIEGVIAEAREALNAAGETAIRESFTKRIRVELNEVEAAGEKAAQAAQATAERLSRQMISVAETAAAVEARIAQADAKLLQASQDDLARRSNLLIEALNSASIDVAKALSTEVPDTAWAAYLKGDRGIFTRRAVRLLDGGDTRAVVRRYNEDNEFRESVSKYIADFEALMRRTMAERNGGSLSVALLSSDVGKLYVALAQALERIRS